MKINELVTVAENDDIRSISKVVNYLLSVIIPFRLDPNLPYLLERLEDQCLNFPRHDKVEFIVVDSGSPIKIRHLCQEICSRHGINYFYHKSEGQTFSIGAARDFGVRHAKGSAVTFLDVDLRVGDDFWSRLLCFMTAFGISKNKKAFFAIPCLYLTQDGTAEFVDANPQMRYLDFHLRWLNGDTQSIETMAPCSSVMIVDRLHYLSVGGHRPEFRGHGYEDFELYHRLIGEEGVLPKAHDYYKDTKSWDPATFNGFRSQLSLIGRSALLANLFVIHLWHPRPKKSSFYGGMQVNREIWMDFFKEFDKTKEHPEPLIDFSACEMVIFLGKPRTNPVRCLRDIFPIVGSPVFVNEYDFIDEGDCFIEDGFKKMIAHHTIRKIIFSNPYGNSARLKIYEWCRRTNFPYICFERGALPDSWFFDPNGFNADSGSYAKGKWENLLLDSERENIINYINKTLLGQTPLEKQDARVGRDALAASLQIGGKKVLFVPLQRPSDTVIRYMLGELASYEDFVQFIDAVAQNLKRLGWVVLCKRHPLETDSPVLNHAQYAPENANFIDLLDLADSVALINSGVGVYAMMMGKPCFIFGSAFYAFKGINQSASTGDVNIFCDQVSQGFVVDMESAYKFINFLTSKFYSFGISRNMTRKETDGSLRNITTAIDFYEIRLPGQDCISYARGGRMIIPTTAPLLERFKLDIINKRIAKSTIVVQAPAAVSKNFVIKVAVPNLVIPLVNSNAVIKSAKWMKLRRDPYTFFKDSRQPLLSPLRHLFSKGRN